MNLRRAAWGQPRSSGVHGSLGDTWRPYYGSRRGIQYRTPAGDVIPVINPATRMGPPMAGEMGAPGTGVLTLPKTGFYAETGYIYYYKAATGSIDIVLSPKSVKARSVQKQSAAWKAIMSHIRSGAATPVDAGEVATVRSAFRPGVTPVYVPSSSTQEAPGAPAPGAEESWTTKLLSWTPWAGDTVVGDMGAGTGKFTLPKTGLYAETDYIYAYNASNGAISIVLSPKSAVSAEVPKKSAAWNAIMAHIRSGEAAPISADVVKAKRAAFRQPAVAATPRARERVPTLQTVPDVSPETAPLESWTSQIPSWAPWAAGAAAVGVALLIAFAPVRSTPPAIITRPA